MGGGLGGHGGFDGQCAVSGRNAGGHAFGRFN